MTINIGSAQIAKIRLADQGSDPAAPASGYKYLYVKSDGLYLEKSDGTVIGPFAIAGTPGTHAPSHENGGDDEISVAGLSGELADAQTPKNHDHSGDAGDGGTFDAANLTSGAAGDGQVLTADGVGGAAWEAVPAGLTNPMTTAGDIIKGGASGTPERLAVGTDGYKLASTGTAPAWEPDYVTINFVIDGGGAAIATGIKGDIVIDFACTLLSWTLLADQSGAIKIDVWRDTYANFPPTDADSLTNAHEPEIAASGEKAQDTDLSDWTSTAIVAGDVIRFNVDSITTCQRVTLSFKAIKT